HELPRRSPRRRPLLPVRGWPAGGGAPGTEPGPGGRRPPGPDRRWQGRRHVHRHRGTGERRAHPRCVLGFGHAQRRPPGRPDDRHCEVRGMTVRVGIDLGGTKIEAVALAPGGEELARRRRPTPRGDYEGILRTIGELIDEVSAGLAAGEAVGLGAPGPVSPFDGLLKYSNPVVLNG